jgi:hypothetical protein
VRALEHEGPPARAKIAFSTEGLEILDWEGPTFPATLRLLPKGGTSFEAPGAGKPARFEFVRKEGRVTALKTGGLTLERAE